MRIKTVGNKNDIMAVVFRNADTAAIPAGSPICLVINGTNDGLDAVLPSTGGASKAHAFAYGAAISPVGPSLASIPANGFGEAQIFGFNGGVVLTRQTRSASSVSWNSEASIASFVLLQIDTVANGFSTSGGTQAATAYLPFAILCQSLASYASSTSATSDTRTAITASVKAFLRII
jgi:hypothetical protein